MTKIRTYSELSKLDSFKERFEYLKIGGAVGYTTFGHDRYLNQQFYRSVEWKRIRDVVISRDNGCDLGIIGFEIHIDLIIHHMNPIELANIIDRDEWILDPEYLITTTLRTHNAIHYGTNVQIPEVVTERKKNDTKLW